MDRSFTTYFDLQQVGAIKSLNELTPMAAIPLSCGLTLLIFVFLFKKYLIRQTTFDRTISHWTGSDFNLRSYQYGTFVLISIIVCFGGALFAFVLYAATYMQYRSLLHEIEEGREHVVVGYVENFKAYDPSINNEDYMDNAREEFDIAGIKFAFSPNVETSAYHQIKAYGGVIESGKFIRLTYIAEKHNNAIVRVEVSRE